MASDSGKSWAAGEIRPFMLAGPRRSVRLTTRLLLGCAAVGRRVMPADCSALSCQSRASAIGMRSLVGLLPWFATTFGAAYVGARCMPDAWYRGLVKPSWTPANQVFGPV